jgi:pimeloyl-ACP methyl ester carboxylesterase
MPTAAVNGTEIVYTDSALNHRAGDHGAGDHGAGDIPAVLLSHGFLMDHTMFGPQLQALVPEFRVITWDQRGFGGTGPRGRSPSGTRPGMP